MDIRPGRCSLHLVSRPTIAPRSQYCQQNFPDVDMVRIREGEPVAARGTLKINEDLLDVIREIKATGQFLYAMSNISAPDWEVLKRQPVPWDLFDHVYTSADARERKPDLSFFHHVINSTGVDPTSTIFVDDKVENVLAARSFGMHGIVFDTGDNAIRQLRNLCGDLVGRARDYLVANKKNLTTSTSNGVVMKENFAQLLILEATGDETLVDYVEHQGQWNFFQGDGIQTTANYPNDLDTTAIGLTVCPRITHETRQACMDEILSLRNEDGIIQVYFDDTRPRIDPVVCVNVLSLFYRNDRGHELEETLDWVEKVLVHRACISGSLYYITIEAFYYFLTRLMLSSPSIKARLGRAFRACVIERFGAEGDALALAMRVYAAASVGIIARTDYERLLRLQEDDGSWKNGWFYRYGASGVFIGNDGVTTAIAIQAIQAVDKVQDGGGHLE